MAKTEATIPVLRLIITALMQLLELIFDDDTDPDNPRPHTTPEDSQQ